MIKAEPSEALMWGTVVVFIGGGIMLGLPPMACGFALLVVMALLYFLGRPR